MTNKAILGLGMGDEGKGSLTEYLCSQDPENTLVVRFSGGQQAAHTVNKGDIKHVFHHFGSGTLSRCPTYWSKYCTFNPMVLWDEYLELKAKGIDPKLYIHPDCAVTTPYDMYPSKDSQEYRHGTTGHGIFRTKERHASGPALTLRDLVLSPGPELDKVLEDIRKYYDTEALDLERYWNSVFNIRSRLGTSLIIAYNPPVHEHIVFEGSQGLMLDEHIGHMPHCTPSDITPRPILEMGYDLDEIFLVTRAYQTRHGNGPMTNEKHSVKPINNEAETCTYNEYQGEFRTTVLDLDILRHAKVEGIDNIVPEGTTVNLVVTCMDQMEQYPVTFEGGKYLFFEPKSFIHFLSTHLCINGQSYRNNSPLSSSITKI